MSAPAPAAREFFTCPACKMALDESGLSPTEESACPGCGVRLRGRVFPVWSRPALGSAATSERAFEGEAVCFFHPTNRASRPCDSCGRFVCTICDLQVGARHLCPTCLSSGLGKRKLPEVVTHRFLWARAAFLLGLAPIVLGIFMWVFMAITGCVAIALAAISWNRPGSLVRGRQRWAAIVGGLLGLAQIAIFVGVIIALGNARSR